MLGTRQDSVPIRGRRYLALLPVFALLAFAWLPVSAQASGVPEYEEALPEATGKNTIPTRSEPRGNSSKADGGGSTADGQDSSGGMGGSGGGSSSKPGGGSDAAKDAGNGPQQGSRGKDSQSQPAEIGNAQPASTESDDGSSPLPAILIAIAVLAAISIAVLVIRRRREGGEGGSGTPVSPEAN